MTAVTKAADEAIRKSVKLSLRHYGVATAALRALPDFAIIGAKRGGTTSLYNYLLEHPAVLPMFPGRQHVKGTHYFDAEYRRGPAWYRSHFPITVADHRLTRPMSRPSVSGEGSPYYLFHPLAAARMAAEVPNIRLIVLLRDPVERAYSHYKERVRNGAETLTFEDALDAEPDRLEGEAERIVAEPDYASVEHEDHSYVSQGRYVEMLTCWFERFPRDQFLIVASEDFYEDPNRVSNEAWSFLGLPPATLRSRRRHNFHQAPDLLPATRRRLQQSFAEHNRELELLLGRSLPWPSAPGAGSGPAHEANGTRSSSNPAQASATHSSYSAGPGDGQGEERWPAVSVIVPTRNRPQQLERAVQSILGQSYDGRIECIVVFDQSPPVPVRVALPDGRTLRVVSNSRSPGLAGARNSGYLAADTPLVASCDDDDEWAPEKLRLQIVRLLSSSAEVVASGVRIHYGDRTVTRLPPPSVPFAELLRSRVTALHPSTFVVRREALFDGIGLVDEELPGSYGEDYDWLLRAARRRPIIAVEEPLIDVYWHPQSYFAERWETIVDALEYLLRKHPELSTDRTGLARIQGQIAFAQAARGHRQAAYKALRLALRNNPLERRSYLALGVALGVVPATTVVRLANRRGRGI